MAKTANSHFHSDSIAFFPEWASAQGSLLVGGPLGLDRPHVRHSVGIFFDLADLRYLTLGSRDTVRAIKF